MNEEGDEQTRTYITKLITDNHGHIIGFKTATENVEDTNTTYTFEGQSDEATSVYFQVTSSEDGASAEVVYLDAYSKNEAEGKFVAKEEGKSLVSDDEIARLADVDNYDDEEVRGLIGDNAKAIEDLETYVGTIPTDEKYADVKTVISYVNKKAEETLAAAQGGSSETAASVKQQLDNYKSENDTRVKAVEDDIDAINNADTGILKQAKDYADGLAGNYDAKGAAADAQAAAEAKVTALAEGQVAANVLAIEANAQAIAANKTAIEAIYKVDGENKSGVLVTEIARVEGKADANALAIAAINNNETGILALAKAHTAQEISKIDLGITSVVSGHEAITVFAENIVINAGDSTVSAE